jgi:prepilin-type N-terminal cleavage/methylation domain-containing protein/prepilin-type processing-associated H-X9-DG protein
MSRGSAHRSAFTLIELLVVIAIIAILAAILFPVFAQAREKARSATCISNQKQIANALMMYVQDYDEVYPQAEYGDGGAFGPQQQWYEMVWPYIKIGDRYTDAAGISYSWGNGGVYRCPTHADPNQGQVYGLHMDLFPRNYGGGTWATHSMAAVDAPAEKIFMVEKGRNGQTWSVPYYGTYEWDWTAWVGLDRATGQVQRDGSEIAVSREGDDFRNDNANWWAQCGMLPRYRHSSTTNVLFGDGHAKTFPKNGIMWYKNVFIPVGEAAQNYAAGWYPY